MPKKKVKDLDPKNRSKKVKGGGLGQAAENVTENVSADVKGITRSVVRTPRSVIRDVVR